MTVDVDLTVFTGFGGEEDCIQGFLKAFESRIEDAKGFAERTRVLLLKSASGVGIDLALGAMPFEERTISRATAYILDERHSLTTCSAEDLIVHKAFANRDQDWMDIRGVLCRQSGRLNRDLVLTELEPLVELKEDPKILERLRRLWEGDCLSQEGPS